MHNRLKHETLGDRVHPLLTLCLSFAMACLSCSNDGVLETADTSSERGEESDEPDAAETSDREEDTGWLHDTSPPEPACGDGVVDLDLDEECDDGNADWTDGCTPECRVKICGDNVIQGTEQCDDGNLVPGDGCEPSCRFVPWVSVQTGRSHTCALDANGVAECWGLGSVLEDEGHSWDNNQALPPDESFAALSLGADTSCGRLLNGEVICWGQGDNGELDTPSGFFSLVAFGGWHGCVLDSDGRISCWGGADGGILSEVTSPPTDSGYTALASGGWHSCAFKADGHVACWGPLENPLLPVPSGLEPFSAISAGASHVCGIYRDNGQVICWGRDDEGQANPPSGRFQQIFAGEQHSCALDAAGYAICWGYDGWGNTAPPAEIWQLLDTGWKHTCGLTVDGRIRCWGQTDYGKLAVP